MSIEQVWAVVVTAVITGLVGYIFGYVKDSNREQKEEEKRKQEHEKTREEDFKHLVEQQAQMFEQYQKLSEQVASLALTIQHVTNGGKVLLRDRIIQSCRVFIEKGYITLTARSNIADMYKWYHDELHGNGLGEIYFNRMMELDIVDDGLPEVSHMNLEERL